MENTITRGRVASLSGVNKETVRFYENRGLLPRPPRSGAGYRRYDQSYVERIRFIRRAQELGFRLDEITELLQLQVQPGSDRGDVRERAVQKLEEVEAKIEDLKRIQHALHHLVMQCDGHGPTEDCPILGALGSDQLFRDVLPENNH